MSETILVVEDQKEVREDIVDILESADYCVLAAECGGHALEISKSKLPDLVISDIMMPGMNGYELLENFQSNPILQNIPFIFLSAKSSENDLRSGMIKGADDYITKPFRAKDLLKSIETRLAKFRKWQNNFDKLRDNFALTVPHELRTPLIPLLGYSDIILEDIKKISKEEIYELVERIKMGAVRLHNRVEKFILLSSLQFDKNNFIELKNIRKDSTGYPKEMISSVVKSVVNAFARSNDLDLILQSEQNALKIPEFYLNTIIKELVENACKFSLPGNKILVEGKNTGDFFELNINNEGKGFPEKHLVEFNRSQDENFNTSTTGGGIGLLIVKKILEIIEGTIFIESSLNNYTKVIICIPVVSIKIEKEN